MRFETPAGDAVGVLVVQRYEAFLPADGKAGGVLADTLGIDPVGLLEHRRFAEEPVDEICLGLIGIVEGQDVGLDGAGGLDGQSGGDGRQDRLAPDDDDLVGLEEPSGGNG